MIDILIMAVTITWSRIPFGLYALRPFSAKITDLIFHPFCDVARTGCRLFAAALSCAHQSVDI